MILGYGNACLDIINVVTQYPAEDSQSRVISQKICRGGNASNTLTVLSQFLGNKCHFVGTLGSRSSSAFITRGFDRLGIDYSAVEFDEDHTPPTSYITVSSTKNTRTIINYRTLPEMKADQFLNRVADVSRFDWIHFEGRNIPESLQVLQHIARHGNESGQGKERPMVSVEFERPRNSREHELQPFADVLFFSTEYLTKKLGRLPNTPEKFLRELRSKGEVRASAVLVAAWGSTGAYALAAETEQDSSSSSSSSSSSTDRCTFLFVPAVPLAAGDIVDTVGAGDTFNAGFIHGMLQTGNNVGLALEFAVRLAADKITQTGFEVRPKFSAGILHAQTKASL